MAMMDAVLACLRLLLTTHLAHIGLHQLLLSPCTLSTFQLLLNSRELCRAYLHFCGLACRHHHGRSPADSLRACHPSYAPIRVYLQMGDLAPFCH